MTFEEINAKYAKDRGEMTRGELEDFITDCYTVYEEEGFAKVFWSPYDQYKNRIGQHFDVIRRIETSENDIEVLPMWEIKFEDGLTTLAYPEEIVMTEMVANGYVPTNNDETMVS